MEIPRPHYMEHFGDSMLFGYNQNDIDIWNSLIQAMHRRD
jgi:hypothetical protein